MITDIFTPSTDAIVTPEAFYGEQQHLCDTCLVTFSEEIQKHILSTYLNRKVAEKKSCRGNEAIYVFKHDGQFIGLLLSSIGASAAGTDIIEVNWLTGATKFVMFGSAGSLVSDETKGRYVVPTKAYRDEGMSYHYQEANDTIEIPGHSIVAKVMDYMDKPYIKSPIWTTDALYRETKEIVRERISCGCVAVDMEVSGVQAVCNFHGFELYDFLECGDVLDDEEYDNTKLQLAHHSLEKLDIALEIARRIR